MDPSPPPGSRKVILYISMSVDGYLATPDDGLDWLSSVQQEGEDYGYAALTESVDTYIVGRKTYDVVRAMLGGDFPPAREYDCYVITREDRPPADGIRFYTGSVADLIRTLRQRPGKHIYCDGGGEIVRLFMEQDLIDEYVLSVIPVLLGKGKRLFLGGTATLPLVARSSRRYPSGLVQLRYGRDRPVGE